MGAYIWWEEEPIFSHQGGRTFLTNEQRQKFYKEPKGKAIEVEAQDDRVVPFDLNDILND